MRRRGGEGIVTYCQKTYPLCLYIYNIQYESHGEILSFLPGVPLYYPLTFLLRYDHMHSPIVVTLMYPHVNFILDSINV